MTIYRIMEVKDNGDETVMPSTFDDELEACKYALACFTNAHALGQVFTTYRVDAVEPSKVALSSLYGRTTHYASTDSLAVQPERADFTTDELFPKVGGGYMTQTCQECGSLVNVPYHEKHVSWHNKLLP